MKNNKKILILTNCILVSVLISVFAIMFFPNTSQPIYGGEEFGAIYRGNEKNRNVSLMFNVYENAEVVNGIIDVLNKYGVKATFFVGGCFIDDNVDVLHNIKESGNEIANHGYYHKDHKSLGYAQNQAEIKNCDDFIFGACGVKVNLFAPPSGSFSNETLKACYDLNYKVIMWSKDTIDWRDSDQNKIFYRATNNVSNGDLILMHPKPHTLVVLPSIIEFYKKLNFNLVTVSQNIAD